MRRHTCMEASAGEREDSEENRCAQETLLQHPSIICILFPLFDVFSFQFRYIPSKVTYYKGDYSQLSP